MNGTRYGSFIDAEELDCFGVAGSSSSSKTQSPYQGPQAETYDPSAVPRTSRVMGSYHVNKTNASYRVSAPSQRNQQQELCQQQQLLQMAAMNNYIQQDQNSLLNSLLGNSSFTPSVSSYRHHGVSGTSQYQQLTPAQNGTPYDGMSLQLVNQNAVNPIDVSSDFDDLLLSAFINQPAAPVSSVFEQSSAAAGARSNSCSRMVSKDMGHEPWLDEIKINVASLSLEPLSGSDILKRLHNRMSDVITKYLPCVDFLVQCQQELRKGLVQAQRKVGTSRRYFQQSMTPRQFWAAFVEPLPQKFYSKNQLVMEKAALDQAVLALEKLKTEAKASCDSSCEAVKNTFLGGMKEGESWGLRKWLSRHGNALAVCTDLECILRACKTLDKSLDSTKNLAKLLRPLAGQTLARLKSDVPVSYQEHSSAHPYLPFFHRLESALREVSQFDPDDDGIICLDDSDDDDDVVEITKSFEPPPAAKRISRKRKAQTPPPPMPAQAFGDSGEGSSSGSDEECEVIEVVGMKQAPLEQTAGNASISSRERTKKSDGSLGFSDDALLDDFDPFFSGLGDDGANSLATFEDPKKKKKKRSLKAEYSEERISQFWPTPVSDEEFQRVSVMAAKIATRIDDLAIYFIEHREAEVRPSISPHGHFWNGERYADALKLFGSILRRTETPHFMERVNDDRLAGTLGTDVSRYSHIVKNPIGFKDIAAALLVDPEMEGNAQYGNGRLPGNNLATWNMWKGVDLLQAMDLVLLNSLAFGKVSGEGRSRHRARTNELRKFLWTRIQEIITNHVGADSDLRRQYTPTRRSENSGFVIYKCSVV